ncbi:MAG TPA: hypothetical protein VFX18_01360 [Candidatus Nitrosocosmicus sp.]|nr:hypothetical protein [Candidatus Nitrosocosmicus sp.]
MVMKETTSDLFEVDAKDTELYKMKIELIQFVKKMKAEGFLQSVEYPEIPFDFDFEKR